MLEFIALAVNFFVFSVLFAPFVNESCQILLHCDSLASVVAVAFESPHSKMMKFVLKELNNVAAFKQLKQVTAVTHEAGPGNMMADAAARNYAQVLDSLPSQMRLKLMSRKLPSKSIEFINRAVEYFRALSKEERGLAMSQKQNPDSSSYPWTQPPRMLDDSNDIIQYGDRVVVFPTRIPSLLEPGEKGDEQIADVVVVASGQSASEPLGAQFPQQMRLPLVRGQPPLPRVCQESVHPANPCVGHQTLRQKRSHMVMCLAEEAASEIAKPLQFNEAFARGSVNVPEMLSDMFRSILQSVPVSTADKDGRDWEQWSSTMQRLGVSPLRTDIAAHLGHNSDTGQR